MLLAHIVPAYFAVDVLKPKWSREWGRWQRVILWIVAIGSTIAPDSDVIINVLTKGFAGHSTLWTHSIIPYLVLGLGCMMLKRAKRAPLLSMCITLVLVGGLSHLVLDVIVHGTPLLYPINLTMFGFPPRAVVEGGLVAYLTHPILLLELILVGLVAAHWIAGRSQRIRSRNSWLLALSVGIGLVAITYCVLLPWLRIMFANLSFLAVARL